MISSHRWIMSIFCFTLTASASCLSRVGRTSATAKNLTDRHRQCISGLECSHCRSHHRDSSLCSYLARFCFLHKRRFCDIANGALNRTRVHDHFSTPLSHSSPFQLPPSEHRGLPTSAPLAHQTYQHPASIPNSHYRAVQCCRARLHVATRIFFFK